MVVTHQVVAKRVGIGEKGCDRFNLETDPDGPKSGPERGQIPFIGGIGARFFFLHHMNEEA